MPLCPDVIEPPPPITQGGLGDLPSETLQCIVRLDSVSTVCWRDASPKFFPQIAVP